MSSTLFSTYKQGENRVTASMLAVFERISFAIVERILQALCQETESNLLIFQNQPGGVVSVPDAVIQASFAYWIETKIEQNAVSKDQIERHLQALNAQSKVDRQRLLVITPDVQLPKALETITDERVAWNNFESLVEVINALLTKDAEWLVADTPLPTEREQELLRELVRFLVSEGLVGITEQAVVVAARIALQEYLKYSVYMCQPNRTFQPSSHLAFYANGRIHRQIPRIIGQTENIILSRDAVRARNDLPDETRSRLFALITALEKDGSLRVSDEKKVIFLSAPDDRDTLNLKQDIVNDLTSESGRTIAFVQGQRYVALDRLKKHPSRTSELIE